MHESITWLFYRSVPFDIENASLFTSATQQQERYNPQCVTQIATFQF